MGRAGGAYRDPRTGPAVEVGARVAAAAAAVGAGAAAGWCWCLTASATATSGAAHGSVANAPVGSAYGDRDTAATDVAGCGGGGVVVVVVVLTGVGAPPPRWCGA